MLCCHVCSALVQSKLDFLLRYVHVHVLCNTFIPGIFRPQLNVVRSIFYDINNGIEILLDLRHI